MSYVKKFNPYDLPEKTLLAIATGRERVLEDILSLIARNAEGGPVQHLQVVAPRGYGKSFLMRLVQSALSTRVAQGLPAVLALLPEEQHNVDAPHRLLNEIQRVLEGRPPDSLLGSAFSDDEGAWEAAVEALDAAIAARLPAGQGVAVAIIENFDQLMSEVFRAPREQSRLRALLSRPDGRLMLLATATRRADADYEQRLFHATRIMELEPWQEESCIAFFERLRGERQEGPMSPQALGKARAIAQFIGGSPRMATVLAEVLDSNDSLQAARILDVLVDELTPYYKHRIESLSRRARTLLDALLRMGEPRTQSEIAGRLGTAQARIAEPFNELRARGEVVGVKAQHSAEMLYRVGDRLMAYYYRKRHLTPGEGTNLLEGIVAFLATFYTFEEKQAEAERLRSLGHANEAATLDRLVASEKARVLGKQPGLDEDWLDQLRERILSLVDARQTDEAIMICQQAAQQADASGDSRGLTRSQCFLGWSLFMGKRHGEAEETLRRAITLAEQAGDIREQAASSKLLGWLLGQLGRHTEAAETLRHAIALATQVGDIREQAASSRHLGWSLGNLGRHTEAAETLRHAITLAERVGDAWESAWAAFHLIATAQALGDDTNVIKSWHQACASAAAASNMRNLPDIAPWFSNASAAALRSSLFGAVWSTATRLAIPEIYFSLAQRALARTIAEASQTQGRAAAYSLAAQGVEVLAQDAAERARRNAHADPDPITFLRGIFPTLAQQVKDPDLLRDIASLLEQRLPSETVAERAFLEAAARRAENPEDMAALERLDPDVTTALERTLGLPHKPAPKAPARRGKRGGSLPRRKK